MGDLPVLIEMEHLAKEVVYFVVKEVVEILLGSVEMIYIIK